MARIIALDIGGKRTGIAVTDPLQMIATGLEGIDTAQLVPYLKKYLLAETVEMIIVGKPMQMNYTESESWGEIRKIADTIMVMTTIKVCFFSKAANKKLKNT